MATGQLIFEQTTVLLSVYLCSMFYVSMFLLSKRYELIIFLVFGHNAAQYRATLVMRVIILVYSSSTNILELLI